MARQVEELKKEAMVSQGIIQDFVAEKLERQKQDEFYKEYFKQRVKGPDTTQCIKDA
jgi:hypothetical protein